MLFWNDFKSDKKMRRRCFVLFYLLFSIILGNFAAIYKITSPQRLVHMNDDVITPRDYTLIELKKKSQREKRQVAIVASIIGFIVGVLVHMLFTI